MSSTGYGYQHYNSGSAFNVDELMGSADPVWR